MVLLCGFFTLLLLFGQVVLLNKGTRPLNVSVDFATDSWGDFYPARMAALRVRDLLLRQDLGDFVATFVWEVEPHDAAIFKMTPVGGGGDGADSVLA